MNTVPIWPCAIWPNKWRRRIALLRFDTLTAPMLQVGYEQALTALGLQPCPPEVPCALEENDMADLDRKCDQLVHAIKDGRLDAVLVHNDSIALPLVSRPRAAGVQVPDDLAVVTYDDELAALAAPPITFLVAPQWGARPSELA